NADCPSALCLASGRCTRPCAGAGDCPPSWSCGVVAGAGELCQCTLAGPETCNGKDDDCNGLVDEGSLCGAGAACVAGAGACGAGKSPCPSGCQDLNASADNCGACGARCGAGATCAGGHCQCSGCRPGEECRAGGTCSCPSPRTSCPNACVDLQSDLANCGG